MPAQKTGPPSGIPAYDVDSIGRLAFSPTSKTLAGGSSKGNIVLWDVATGRTIKSIVAQQSGDPWLDFSPDGHLLATTSWGSSV